MAQEYGEELGGFSSTSSRMGDGVHSGHRSKCQFTRNGIYYRGKILISRPLFSQLVSDIMVIGSSVRNQNIAVVT
jgi:hypothetical protein